jgi:Dirigent-like protein
LWQASSNYEEVTMARSARRIAAITAGMTLAAGGALGVATAASGNTAKAVKYYGFDINNTTTDPGFVAAPGTSPSTFSQGDQLIINDQLTVTHKRGSGYPIVGHDSGVCTLTRIPEKYAEQTLGNCVVTAVVNGSSLTVQGVVRFKAQQPQPAVLAVTGGTGRFRGATGSVDVSFAKKYKILTFHVK